MTTGAVLYSWSGKVTQNLVGASPWGFDSPSRHQIIPEGFDLSKPGWKPPRAVVYGRGPLFANVLLDDGRVVYVSLIQDRSTRELELAVLPRRKVDQVAARLWLLGALLVMLLPTARPFWKARFRLMKDAQQAIDTVCAALERGVTPQNLGRELTPGR